MAGASHHKILIVGGGAAGITVAAELRRHDHADALDIAIVEPADVHYYQPALTLVGAGAYDLAKTCRAERSLIPAGVAWIKDAATAFAPDSNTVSLSSGRTVTYDYLVVCPGLTLNWDAIKGLRDSIGANGVCSNYSPDTAEYTWETLKNAKRGAKILCTQPPMPFKCPGAPQKIAYLAADYLKRGGIRDACEVRFLTHAPAIFGVPFYARELVKIAANHGIVVQYQHNLIEVDGPGRTATFEIVGGDRQGSRITLPFDMLHVTPPQAPPAALKQSPLVNAAGFTDVHANSLQHVKYKNVFGLGDAAGTANSKTAAAVRKQAPVVVRNLLHLMGGSAIEEAYDGYASCPLTTAYGKVLMAEFIYGGKPTPTFPLDPAKEHLVNWWIKTTGLPHLYWDYMLKGFVAFPAHNTHFVEPPAP
ncbi:MAG: NAD(P)/FAD-dependent oxidoreductase [Rhodospirillaceae bacterium]|nr:MAG: NAD(P)/FAD-dependent oxidoreductase [Rhodospirillaceae bacterium]